MLMYSAMLKEIEAKNITKIFIDEDNYKTKLATLLKINDNRSITVLLNKDNSERIIHDDEIDNYDIDKGMLTLYLY